MSASLLPGRGPFASDLRPCRPPKAQPRGPRLYVTVEDIDAALSHLRARSRLFLPTRRPIAGLGDLLDLVLRVRGFVDRLRVPGRVAARRPLRGPRTSGPGLSIEPFDVALVDRWLTELKARDARRCV